MARTHTDTTQPRLVVDRLDQLRDPIRVRMVRLLEREELAVGELAGVLRIPQSSASRHLKVLAEGGWVLKRPAGPATYYRVLLDDLPDDARTIWLAIRQYAERDPECEQDDARLSGVLLERRNDSKAFFGRHAGEWDDLRSQLFGKRFTDQALLALIDPSWVVADLGCGTGNAAELLAPWVRRVVAIDDSPEMLEAAARRLTHYDHVQFVQGDLTSACVEPASVDAAVCLLVLHHIDDPSAVIAQMARMLRASGNGGVALIVDITAHDRADYRHEMGHKHQGFATHEIETMLTDAGFGTPRVEILPPPVDASGPALFVATARITETR